jgi:hypothetical protein
MKRASGLFQGKDCKGLCARFEKSRPYRKPYETHVLCRRCKGTFLCADGVWMEREMLDEKGWCPCCHHRPRHKVRHKTYQNKKLKNQQVVNDSVG